MKKNHFGIYGIIEMNGSLLLVKKSRGPYTGMYDLPGGRPERGEKPYETLSREIFEETGVKVLDATEYSHHAFDVKYEEYGEIKRLHHTVCIYKVHQFDYSAFKNKIDFEDVDEAVWIQKKEIHTHPLSKVVECIL